MPAAMRAVFGPNYWVRAQMSLNLSPFSMPDPDLAVVAGAPRSHDLQAVPAMAVLVVEVSDTSLQVDRTHKMSLYAASGIDDYWILNLVDRQLEVYRKAASDSSQPYGFGYTLRTILDSTDTVTPLKLPNTSIQVADLMP